MVELSLEWSETHRHKVTCKKIHSRPLLLYLHGLDDMHFCKINQGLSGAEGDLNAKVALMLI
jgi:hypothetical protein